MLRVALADTRTARSEDDVRRKRDQLVRIFADVIFIARGPAVVDLDVNPIGPTQSLQPMHQRLTASLRLRIARRVRHEYAQAPHALRLLRTRRQRRSHR